MTNPKKEAAKFFSGFEAFHAIFHAYLWLSGSTFTAFGVTATPTMSMTGAMFNAIISIALALYAWRGSKR